MFTMGKSRKRRKNLIELMLIVLLLNLTACKVDKTENKSEEEISSGEYYSRVLLDMPGDVNPVYISKAGKGGLYVVTQSEGRDSSEIVWYLDNEDKWEKKYDLGDVLNIDGDFYCKAYVSKDGELFVAYNRDIDGSDELEIDCSKMEYCFVDASGKKTNVDMKLPILTDGMMNELEEYYGEKADFQNTVNIARFIDDKIYISDINSNIFEFDKSSCSVKCVYENIDLEYISEFTVYDRTLMMWSGEILYYEGLDSHDNEQGVSDRFLTFFKEAKQSGAGIKMEIDDNMLWTISGDKLCTYNLDNNNFKKTKALGYSQGENNLGLVINDGVAYTLTCPYGGTKNEMNKYVSGKPNAEVGTETNTEVNTDIQSKNSSSNTLKIWALEQGQTFRIAVSCFTEKYPDVNVEIEVGMENGDSGITEVDAIKNLNTEILAGNGPDIIYMDGLNYEKYIESGMLYDMSETVNELKASGQFFNNILDSYKQDESIYIVPSSFSMIEKVGTKEAIKASENFSEFANYVEQNKTDHDVIYKDSIIDYIMLEYYKSFQSDIKAGNVDKNKLREYFDVSKRLYLNAGMEDLSFDALLMYMGIDYSVCYESDGTFDFEISNKRKISDGQIKSEYMAKAIDGIVELPANDFNNRYVVRDCIAINANSANIELAKKYLEEAISTECQGQPNGAVAFCVNKEGLRKYTIDMYNMRMEDVTGTDTDTIEVCLEQLIGKIELLDEPMYVDLVLDQMIFDELNQYIKGSVNRDEAIDSLTEKINLYISE